jgi:hypothetical protein
MRRFTCDERCKQAIQCTLIYRACSEVGMVNSRRILAFILAAVATHSERQRPSIRS